MIVEDNQNLRRALKSLIALSGDFICVGDYDRAAPVIKFEGDIVPDVILMDIDLPGENGIAYTRRIKEKYPFATSIKVSIKKCNPPMKGKVQYSSIVVVV